LQNPEFTGAQSVIPDGNVPLANLPRAYFAAILVDPPWRFETWSDAGKDRSPERHYPTMTMDELRGLDVAALAARDSVLFLWAGWPMDQAAPLIAILLGR
jgi:N6-adenosine-specific RNA methylase IME4